MNKLGMLMIGGLLLPLSTGLAFGHESSATRKEMETLKNGIERPGKTTYEQNAPSSSTGYGERWYEKIDVTIGATGILQGSSGVQDRLSPEGSITDATASYELELQTWIGEDGFVYLHIEAGKGNGIDGEIPTLSSFNGDADDNENVRVTEFLYGHRFEGIGLVLEIGRLCLSGPGDNAPEDAILFEGNEYANNERSQFLSGAFINNPTVEFPDDNGMGAMVRLSLNTNLDISVGVAEADADWDDVFKDIFSIVELNFKPKTNGNQGNYRIYGWFNGKDHVSLINPMRTNESNHGFGLSLDQRINGTFALFARYGRQYGGVSRVEHAWSAGVQCFGKIFGRDDDTFGLAYGMAVIGEEWRRVARKEGINSGDEDHLEFYYNLKVNDHLNISPDIQWVKNPDGGMDNDDVWAFGIRAQLFF